MLNIIDFLLLAIMLLGKAPAASRPEYMKLKVGDAVEVKGNWDRAEQIFVAHDIEKLPEPRRPKLRGAIASINPTEKSFMLYGIKIKVDSQTEFLDDAAKAVRFEELKPKTRLEVTCNVDDKGNWLARKISLGKVKPTDKVKGTVSRLAFDGTPPDTFTISGLKILVTGGTDLFGPWPEK